ncbi:baseplate hub domain-containing protein [Caulobacter sp. RL271]|jgi:hypothetical protein|uniref:DUF2163 domain-containing protein n=1 Tax=Caulobacter segnis TaxID=88688 RepID=A0ABY4ZQN4_9CAUL|nr:DUF2163 domain-containing protein [Caulobacter segnis]USQ94840.1 DUF2163 domain-containing protein [Caulobacter segnis]
MRALPEGLDPARLCQAWIVIRADGVRLGFTDHDRDLIVDGVTCRAGGGWSPGASESAAGYAAGQNAVLGVLDDAGITQTDLAAGLYDGARVAALRVDWRAPSRLVRLWTATIAAVSRDGEAFKATLAGPLAELERVAGRTFTRLCDARLGDGRCGITPPAGATCDKRWATCVGTFANGVNFRGFPTAPGEDFLTLYPAEGERNDGGRR